MKTKDYEPIKFEFMQSEMEKIQFFLGESSKVLAQKDHDVLAYALSDIKRDIERKIEVHRHRKEWL